MSVEALLGIAIVVIAVLYFRLGKSAAALQQQTKDYKTLAHQYQALQNTLSTRGQRLDVLLSTISEVVLRVDKQGRVLGGNAQAQKLFQFDKLPALPQSLLLFYRDNEWMSAFNEAMRALPEQKSLPEMHVNGQILSPKLAALNENEALLLCLDVTAYTQLQRKQKSLLENLMHDLKTPLTSLLGYARSIETFADDKALREEAVAVIAQEAKHINDLVNSMLTLNQIEQGDEQKDEQGGEQCDVAAELKHVWQSLEEKLQHKSVALNLAESTSPLMIKVSAIDCHRVLLNVADNAVKFAPQGSQIDCDMVASDDKFVQVSIRDQGSGIKASLMHRVTERFFRVDKVRGRENAQGHGLGLAIVKEILERDGGELLLQNVEAGGLQVDIRFPKV